jgi:hypothetical protein
MSSLLSMISDKCVSDISKVVRSVYRVDMKSTFEFLQEKYGSLMTVEQLAQALSRKASGLRGVLQKPTEPWMFELNRARRRIGRRIYFPTDAVAALLNGDFDRCNEGDQSVSDRPLIGKESGTCTE